MAKQSNSKKSTPKSASTHKKTPASRTPSNTAPSGSATFTSKPGALPSVRVRMYRQGLGDCFLITFNVGTPQASNMLIDCGTLGNRATSVTFADIWKDIQSVLAETKKTKLDLLVATHEHADHLVGFNGALKDLAGKVDHVWVAWTENPKDPDAQKIATKKGDLGPALAAVANAFPDVPAAQNISSILGFAGDTSLGAAAFATTVNAAMEFVRTKTGGTTEYHQPGDLIQAPWIPGFRFYVLGPPRSIDALKDLGVHGSAELYGVTAGLRAAADAFAPDGSADDDTHRPFGPQFRRDPSLRPTVYPAYDDPREKWRQIDFDWLDAAADLALQLDDMTNNTSLALAIERVADGKVLLFPADAQEGNWLSWETLTWKVTDAGATKEVKSADLLSRTIFYKTGHHCSHNGTAKGNGLELMTSPELTAFIPVDRKIALTRNPKDSWQMPARPLFLQLLRKCNGRVARADLAWAQPAVASSSDKTESEFLQMATAADWTQWTAAQKKAEADGIVAIAKTNLCIDYILKS
jgi:hypothetical protein